VGVPQNRPWSAWDTARAWLRRHRQRFVGAAVVACVLAVAAAAALKLDEALGLYDWRADENAALSYLARAYGDRGWIGDRDVVEDARLRMPEDATYAIVFAPGAARRGRSNVIREFLVYHLYPRRLTPLGEASWAFCYGCRIADLGPRFRQLAQSDDGTRFGRLAR